MTIWLIIEQHRAEGESVLSVRASRPSPEECERVGCERSLYSGSERAAWCKMRCDMHDVEDYHGTADCSVDGIALIGVDQPWTNAVTVVSTIDAGGTDG